MNGDTSVAKRKWRSSGCICWKAKRYRSCASSTRSTPASFINGNGRSLRTAPGAFEGAGNARSDSKLEKEVEALESRLQRKHEVLSELMEEHIRLKKDLGELWTRHGSPTTSGTSWSTSCGIGRSGARSVTSNCCGGFNSRRATSGTGAAAMAKPTSNRLGQSAPEKWRFRADSDPRL